MTHQSSTTFADNINWFNYKLSQWHRFWVGHGYASVPNITGLRVLEFGCGLGGHAISAALAGAEVVGIDLDGQSLQFAQQMLGERFPQLKTRVKFLQMRIEDYKDSQGFDYILTYETFEHVLDLPSALQHLARLLKPSGTLISTFGGLWTSAFGGHDLQYYLEWTKNTPWGMLWLPRVTSERRTINSLFRAPIPFSHRFMTGKALKDYGRRYPDRPHGTIQEVGMNGLAFSDYVKIIGASPFKVIRWKTNVGKHPAYIILRLLAGVPGLQDLFTQNVYAVMVPREPSHLTPHLDTDKS